MELGTWGEWAGGIGTVGTLSFLVYDRLRGMSRAEAMRVVVTHSMELRVVNAGAGSMPDEYCFDARWHIQNLSSLPVHNLALSYRIGDKNGVAADYIESLAPMGVHDGQIHGMPPGVEFWPPILTFSDMDGREWCRTLGTNSLKRSRRMTLKYRWLLLKEKIRRVPSADEFD